jgi:hypothetical protein
MSPRATIIEDEIWSISVHSQQEFPTCSALGSDKSCIRLKVSDFLHSQEGRPLDAVYSRLASWTASTPWQQGLLLTSMIGIVDCGCFEYLQRTIPGKLRCLYYQYCPPRRGSSCGVSGVSRLFGLLWTPQTSAIYTSAISLCTVRLPRIVAWAWISPKVKLSLKRW